MYGRLSSDRIVGDSMVGTSDIHRKLQKVQTKSAVHPVFHKVLYYMHCRTDTTKTKIFIHVEAF
jgi:hypothetical protein